MNAHQFIRQRVRIEQRFAPGRKRQDAIANLVRDARAAVILIHRKAIGYRMTTGEVVCIKHRYRTHEDAVETMAKIHAATGGAGHVPVRAYPCPYCKGFHLTSRQ